MTDFEAVYARHFDSVYRYVYSLCRDEHTAEEITQEAFYKAMTHMDTFDGKCRLYVWLCQIAKNTYFTYAKRTGWTSRTRRCSPCGCSGSCHFLRSGSCSASRTAGRG